MYFFTSHHTLCYNKECCLSSIPKYLHDTFWVHALWQNDWISLLLWTLPTEDTLVRERRAPGQLKPLIMAAFLSDASLVTPWYYAGWLIMTHHRAGASFITALAPGLSPHYSRPVTENKQALPLALTTALISSSVPVCNDSSEPAWTIPGPWHWSH